MRRAPAVLVAFLLLIAPAVGAADPSFGLGAVSPPAAAFLLLRQAGVRAVKIIADWSTIEPTRGRFLWQDLDAAVAAARKEGLTPVVVLTHTPPWASLATGEDARDRSVATRSPPRRVADWERFVTEAVRRYRDAVKEWQVWTITALPYFRGTASEYLALIQAARKASAAVDPTSRIVVASPPGFDLGHVQRALAQAPAAVSVISLAPTGDPDQWARPLAALRQRVLARVPRPVWVEWNPERTDGISPAALLRATAIARAAGVERLFTSTDLRRLDDPARAALAALDAPFSGYLVREPGVYALVFGTGERAALVAWRQEGGPSTLEVPVLPAARLVVLDGRAPAAVADGKIAVGTAPVILAGVGGPIVDEARATVQQRGPLLPVVPPDRDFAQAREVSIRLGRDSAARGLQNVLRNRRNGAVEPVEVAGEEAVRPANSREGAFIYFDVDDTFVFFNDGRHDLTVIVEVRGARGAQNVGFNLFYDARTGYRFTTWQWVEVRDGWVSYAFRLDDASFANTWGWDFAINAGANQREELIVRAVTLRKGVR